MTSSLRSVQGSRAGPSAGRITAWAAWMIAASVALLVAGFIWPQAADALLRLLLATVAVGFVAALAYRTIRPVMIIRDTHSPFRRRAAGRKPAMAPQALRKLTRQLSPAAKVRSAQRTAIPSSARATVREEASRRLAEHYGLSLRDSTDHRDIQSLVSEPTWLLIRPRDARPRTGTRLTARSRSVPLSQLGRILDDLEAL